MTRRKSTFRSFLRLGGQTRHNPLFRVITRPRDDHAAVVGPYNLPWFSHATNSDDLFESDSVKPMIQRRSRLRIEDGELRRRRKRKRPNVGRKRKAAEQERPACRVVGGSVLLSV